MNILVVGGGGREHAIIKKLRENPRVDSIYALPGNGGISYDEKCHNISALDIGAIVDFAKEKKIDFAVVGPDDPLALGAVDRLNEANIPAFGPNAAAAVIESSKVFAKNLMKKYNIPTADYRVFDSASDAISYAEESAGYPIVIKADGLALGKGVVIAEDFQEAAHAINSMMRDKIFGKSGDKIVVEEYLRGPEVSVLAFTDAKTLVPMVSSMDHKRALDGDRGANTGGMGAIAPNPFYSDDIAKRCMDEIFLPTLRAMNDEGRPFKGCLYFGLMLTDKGPKVIEYNCRFGDPEAQVVLPLLKTDLLEIMMAVSEERLSEIPLEFSHEAACCLIAASGGYPASYDVNIPIYGLESGQLPGVYVFHAGTKIVDDVLLTSGGRVLGVTARGTGLEEAVKGAYAAMEKISFKGMHYRKDIGKKAKGVI